MYIKDFYTLVNNITPSVKTMRDFTSEYGKVAAE